MCTARADIESGSFTWVRRWPSCSLPAAGIRAALASVLLLADIARSPDDYSVAIAIDPPPESEPGFDIIGPVW